jgi:hypothetical protein
MSLVRAHGDAPAPGSSQTSLVGFQLVPLHHPTDDGPPPPAVFVAAALSPPMDTPVAWGKPLPLAPGGGAYVLSRVSLEVRDLNVSREHGHVRVVAFPGHVPSARLHVACLSQNRMHYLREGAHGSWTRVPPSVTLLLDDGDRIRLYRDAREYAVRAIFDGRPPSAASTVSAASEAAVPAAGGCPERAGSLSRGVAVPAAGATGASHPPRAVIVRAPSITLPPPPPPPPPAALVTSSHFTDGLQAADAPHGGGAALAAPRIDFGSVVSASVNGGALRRAASTLQRPTTTTAPTARRLEGALDAVGPPRAVMQADVGRSSHLVVSPPAPTIGPARTRSAAPAPVDVPAAATGDAAKGVAMPPPAVSASVAHDVSRPALSDPVAHEVSRPALSDPVAHEVSPFFSRRPAAAMAAGSPGDGSVLGSGGGRLQRHITHLSSATRAVRTVSRMRTSLGGAAGVGLLALPADAPPGDNVASASPPSQPAASAIGTAGGDAASGGFMPVSVGRGGRGGGVACAGAADTAQRVGHRTLGRSRKVEGDQWGGGDMSAQGGAPFTFRPHPSPSRR